MAGGHIPDAQLIGQAQHPPEFHIAVAVNAGIGGLPPLIAPGKPVHDLGAELRAKVKHPVGDPQPLRREEDDPPAVGHRDAGGDVVGEEQLLHRHLVRVEGANELFHIVRDLEQAAGQGDARRGGDDAVLDQRVFLTLRTHHPESDGGHARVDA